MKLLFSRHRKGRKEVGAKYLSQREGEKKRDRRQTWKRIREWMRKRDTTSNSSPS